MSSTRRSSPFSRGAVLAVVLVGFLAFLAMTYFIGSGNTGGPDRSGAAHASSNGLNGYSGLVQLLEAEGFDVTRSRQRSGLETTDLLILTPPPFTDPEEFATILQNREYRGPTLVILPKWRTGKPRADRVAEGDRDKLRNDWVSLLGASATHWPEYMPAPFTFSHEIESAEEDDPAKVGWSGLNRRGSLPTGTVVYAKASETLEPVIRDSSGRLLAFNIIGEPGTEYYENAHWTMIVAEPDLMNNYGLADASRASAALALVREAGYGDMNAVTFDLTLNGQGGSVNLLTLAFQPPFLAATLCLILAMIVIGWRAFMRFGPAAASAPEIAFGKTRLVVNGAGLVVRAKRLGLLAKPYTGLIERRLARMLGLVRHDREAVDDALARRLPGEEPFSARAARMENADKPIEILRAAQALDELTDKLNNAKTTGQKTGRPAT